MDPPSWICGDRILSGDVDDDRIVEVQLGRPLRGPIEVVRRCRSGFPLVVRVPPLLADGTPFPTRYWLTCAHTKKLVDHLESSGLIRRLQERRRREASFAAACDAADLAYGDDRDAALPAGWSGARPGGGVAGSHGGVKCLHAHLAHHLAGGNNPIGAEVAALIGPLDDDHRCVP